MIRKSKHDRHRDHPLAKAVASLALAVVVLGAGPAGAELDGWRRLAVMPLSQRQRLAENLKRFDALSPSQQRAIESLDAAVNGLSEVEQQRHVNLLNKYHIWLSNQPPGTRERLASLEPSVRLKAVEEERSKQRERRDSMRGRAGLVADQIQVSALVTESMRVSAIETRLWFMLEPDQRKTILAKANPRDQRRQLQEIVEADAKLQAARQALGQDLGVDLKELREAALRKLDRAKRPNLNKNGPLMQELQRVAELKRFVRNQTPAPTSARNLERFDQSMPPWVRESMDSLPPDAAQTRLRLLYRLVFPSPDELPEPKVEPKAGNDKGQPTVDPNAKPF